MNYFQNVWDWLADGSHWTGPEGVPHRLVQHLQICAISLLVAALIAVPIGVVLGHFGRGGFLAINLSNVGRAIPAIAILLDGRPRVRDRRSAGVPDDDRRGVDPRIPRARRARRSHRCSRMRMSVSAKSTRTCVTPRAEWV